MVQSPKTRIFVVNKEKTLCSFLKENLETANYDVTIVAGENELLASLEQIPESEESSNIVLLNTKSFSPRKLKKQIRATSKHKQKESGILRCDALELTVNLSTCQVCYKGKVTTLRPTEYQILCCLMHKPGKVYTRMQLRRCVRGRRKIQKRTIDVHIGRLRKSLGAGLIRTVSSVGYGLDVQPERPL